MTYLAETFSHEDNLPANLVLCPQLRSGYPKLDKHLMALLLGECRVNDLAKYTDPQLQEKLREKVKEVDHSGKM